MIELLGLIFGGASRLAQHWLDLKDKQAERTHEATMYDKQIELADKRLVHDASMRKLEADTVESQAEWNALNMAIASQAKEASNVGGWVAKFSAVMRPLLTFYHAIVIYTAVKIAMYVVATNGGIPWSVAVISIYNEFDRALLGSMVSYWFLDRGLKNLAKK